MEAIPSNVLDKFREALDLSREHQSFAIASIASELDVSKKWVLAMADEYDTINEMLERIQTNLEANIIRASAAGMMDKGWTKFALESNHGWTSEDKEQPKQVIRISGMSDDEVNQMLLNGE